jgi:hypothetical protein
MISVQCGACGNRARVGGPFLLRRTARPRSGGVAASCVLLDKVYAIDNSARAYHSSWMENDGSFVGTLGSGGDPVYSGPDRTSAADWKWYVDTLIGAQFVVHSSIQPGDIHVQDLRNPITKGLPGLWHRAEEWYSFADNPRASRATISS